MCVSSIINLTVTSKLECIVTVLVIKRAGEVSTVSCCVKITDRGAVNMRSVL